MLSQLHTKRDQTVVESEWQERMNWSRIRATKVNQMSIDEYLDSIERLWPKPGESPTVEVVALCQQAIAEHPSSSTLWYDLGMIMHRCSEEHGFSAEDYLRCFENAVKCNTDNWEALRELGYVLDTYFDEYEKAAEAFKKAISLGADHESYGGYARALAQMGRTEEAIACLSESTCPFHNHPEIQKLRSEIRAGDWYWTTDVQ
jgi:uncharacterized protein HemY